MFHQPCSTSALCCLKISAASLAVLLGIFLCKTVFVIGSIELKKSPKCDKQCFNGGGCRNGTCVCSPGWTGLQCESCFGRVVLSSKSGVITHGIGNYSINQRCTWLIDGHFGSANRLRLSFDSFATECEWDHLFIYGGDGLYAPQLAAISGVLNNVKPSREILVDGSQAYIYFYSDTAYNMSGFNISYRFDACPSGCSENGRCNETTGVCECDDFWTGDACDVRSCQMGCNRRGLCDPVRIGACECELEYRGPNCEVAASAALWEILPAADAKSFGGRASHGAAILGEDMYVVGGEYFQGSNFTNAIRYNFASGKWSRENSKGIPLRYDHSVAATKDHLYVFGGVVNRQNISGELWTFDFAGGVWQKRTSESSGPSQVNKLPYAAAGHTAHIIDGVMLVIFGVNQYRGYLSTVQEYNLESNTWKVVHTEGALPKGTYGHTSVYDEASKLIFVYGGYYYSSHVAAPGIQLIISDALYSYNPAKTEWKILQSSDYHHYLHSAVIISGMMLVFGGNAHNETILVPSKPTQCYANYFLGYDIECGTWHVLSFPDYLPYSINRFGHSALAYNGSMYMFGGFNGQMLSDVILLSPGSCGSQKSSQDCWNFREAIKCVWARDRCMSLSEARSANLTNFEKGCSFTGVGVKAKCEDFADCNSCTNNANACFWCEDDQKCTADGCSGASEFAVAIKEKNGQFASSGAQNGARNTCSGRSRAICDRHQSCAACVSVTECRWELALGQQHASPCTPISDSDEIGDSATSKYKESSTALGGVGSGVGFPQKTTLRGAAGSSNRTCPLPCALNTECKKCVDSGCMWCGNLRRCIDINVYATSFPYGQCLHWATKNSGCEGPDVCSSQLTCDSCRNNGAGCGWCDDGSRTGLGRCIPGSLSGPVEQTVTGAFVRNNSLCAAQHWYFKDCPACQCNGHGYCTNTTDLLDSPHQQLQSHELTCQSCEDLTTGDHCDTCIRGYFGNALNGGNCSHCDCNSQAKDCHPLTGKCYCSTKGVTGERCERCDASGKYVGDPRNETCYYELTVDFVFTFSLNSEEDANITKINFQNRPVKEGADVTFKLECNGNAKVNMTVVSGSDEPPRQMLRASICSKLEKRFDAEEYKIGGSYNTTFHVYVYDFQAPIVLQISFAQSPAIDWIKFFITFASCFLSLLIVAAILWKIKLRWDMYRRRQRMFVEMAQMASRPCGSVQLELSSGQHVLSGHKQMPSPISVEPCSNYKAALVTVAVRLPTGGAKYAPCGQSGLAIASALVTLPPPYSSQLQTPPSPNQDRKVTKRRRRLNCITGSS